MKREIAGISRTCTRMNIVKAVREESPARASFHTEAGESRHSFWARTRTTRVLLARELARPILLPHGTPHDRLFVIDSIDGTNDLQNALTRRDSCCGIECERTVRPARCKRSPKQRLYVLGAGHYTAHSPFALGGRTCSQR